MKKAIAKIKHTIAPSKGNHLVNFMNYEGDIYAYFPNIQVTKDNNQIFSLLEGESTCHKDYFNQSKNATKSEYNPLQKAMIEQGYKLTIKEGHKKHAPNLKMAFLF
jgi:hypothetical protein